MRSNTFASRWCVSVRQDIHRRMALLLSLVFGIVACSDNAPPETTTRAMVVDEAAVARRESFEGPLEGWKPIDGRWQLRRQGDNGVMAQTATDRRFPLTLWTTQRFSAVDITVRFKPISGRVDASGGIVFRAQDGANYYVVRANSLEGNFRLYTVIDADRRQIAGTNIKAPAIGEWHDLRLVAIGAHIQAYLDGQLLLDHHDATFAAGWVGLWTKADAATEFDDMIVRGVTETETQ